MLLVATNSDQTKTGSTAPVTTATYAEGYPSAYLDPVSLGITLLDQEMLESLRIAARIAWPLLKSDITRPLALRISPQPGTAEISLLKGGSAGGLVTLASCATVEGKRLNQDCSASFTVTVENPELLRDTKNPLTKDDIRLGPVDPVSIEIKLTGEHLGPNKLNTVLLHHSQQSGKAGNLAPWENWAPRIERSQQIHLLPVKEGQTLADIIHAMTGDERIERELTRHADHVFAEWEHISTSTKESPHSLRDQNEEHRFDHYVWPMYRIEKPESEQRREARIQKGKDPASTRVPGKRDERVRELLRRLINDGKFLVVYDKAGAGKTVFSWRVRREAASVAMRKELFQGSAPLIIRCDGTWPKHEDTHHLFTLHERIQKELESVVHDKALRAEVARYALEQRRVLVIVDGFDQFSESERQHVVNILLKEKDARDKCHWIVTSRVHTIDKLRHTLFVDKDWTRVRIDPFTPKQQDRYFADIGDRWLETVPDRESLHVLLQLPLVLRMIRRVIDETPLDQPLPVFRTLSELFVVTSRLLLDRAIRTSQKKLEDAGLTNEKWDPTKQMHLLERVLTTLAFQMMIDQRFNAVLDDGPQQEIKNFQRAAKNRFCHDLDVELMSGQLRPNERSDKNLELEELGKSWNWAIDVLKDIELNHRSVTEAYSPERIAFRSRKIMECYAARYLVRHANDDDYSDLRPFLGDEEWDECWRLATTMPTSEVDTAVVRNTFSLLFEPSQHHPRPTEHMFHAWQLMKQDPVRYPGLPEILSSYRQQFLDILAGTAAVPDRSLLPSAEAGDPLKRAQWAAELLTERDVWGYVGPRRDERVWKHSFRELRPTYVKQLGKILRPDGPEGDATDEKLAEWFESPERCEGGPDARPAHTAFALCSNATSQFSKSADDRATLTFLMGASPEDKSADDDEKYDQSDEQRWWVSQTIDSFQMATCCVTRAQYRLFDPHRERDELEDINRKSPDDDCPMIYVNWWDGFCFALWLGDEYRLPNEVQWEGAAWGGLERSVHLDYVVSVPPYHAGFTSNEVNHDGNYPIKEQNKSGYAERTLPVRWDDARQRKADSEDLPRAYRTNGFGLWHVNGNVYEWCESGWVDGTLKGAIDEILSPEVDISKSSVDAGTGRVVRGGSWSYYAWNSRASDRLWDVAEDRNGVIGFRLTRTSSN